MPDSLENHVSTPEAQQETPVCQRCGGTGYIETSGSLSYGDSGYGDPDGCKEPCPDCNNMAHSADGNSSPEKEGHGCMLVFFGALILIGVVISIIVWLAR